MRITMVVVQAADEARAGLDCTGRLFVSDRAQLVFDFHQIVDGLKEVELGGKRCIQYLYLSISSSLTYDCATQHRNDKEGHRPRLLGQSVPLRSARTPSVQPRSLRREVQEGCRGPVQALWSLRVRHRGRDCTV
jgi:hypothetical protein